MVKAWIKYRYFFVFLTLLVSCTDNYVSSIPDYPVNLQLNLITTYPTFKNNINQSLTFTKPIFAYDRIGYGGILVYVGFDGEYYAFDMSCPYEVKTDVRVYPNGIGQAVCEKCGSVYDIGYGNGFPSSGPSKEALKRYKVMASGDVLYISR